MNGRAALWFAVVALGLYHGLNPAMGWPLAVAQGMSERRGRAVFAALLPLGAGHLMAIVLALAPFALLAWYVEWQRALRIGAGVLVLLFGVFKLVHLRHPRMLARIPPTRLAWWSFVMASAHGAGLMLVPVMMGLCAAPGDRAATDSLARASVGMALLVALVHALAGLLAGGGLAWLVYRYLGLRFLRRAWLNLDVVWGLSLVVAGAAGIVLAW